MPASTPRWSTPSIVAPWPGRRPTLGLAAAIVASVLSGAAMADPLIHNSAAHSAPAGMLRGPSAAPYAVYSARFGIDRGTCDRSLVARDMAGRDLTGRHRTAASGQPETPPGPAGQAAMLRGMDAIDQGCVSRVLEFAPDRQTIRWYGAGRAGYADTAYAFTPLATFERNGFYCRDFRAVATRDGRDDQVYGTACRRPDGAWQKDG
ncbi:MAG: hypothetical protein ACK4FK_02545 [Ferrovibrio sp.]|jgi:hypothetical protein|uniref:hypothetical protein n=1 Tax=Ferrovibrio sp. TaxID=1917215 RepID=UPI00391AA05F